MISDIFAGLPVPKNIALFVKGDMETMLFMTSVSFNIPEDVMFFSKTKIGKPKGTTKGITYARHAFIRAQYNRGYSAKQIASFLKMPAVAPVYYSMRLSSQCLDVDPDFRKKYNALIADE
ncbi:MAG: hypothetical protein WCO63_15240 [Bacteroidota bacterium]